MDVGCLKFSGKGSWLAVPENNIIHFNDTRDLGGCSQDHHLGGQMDIFFKYGPLFNLYFFLFAKQIGRASCRE